MSGASPLYPQKRTFGGASTPTFGCPFMSPRPSLTLKGCRLTPLATAAGNTASTHEMPKEGNAIATPAPRACAADPAADAFLLAFLARCDLGRARHGDRRRGSHLPGQALLRGRLAPARRRG